MDEMKDYEMILAVLTILLAGWKCIYVHSRKR